MDRMELFAKVRANTARAKTLGALNFADRFRSVSEDTRAGYLKMARRRVDMKDPECGPLMDGVSARSWHATRAALLAVAGETFRVERTKADNAQKASDMAEAMRATAMASRMLDVIERVTAAERPAVTTARRTKRRTLPRMPGWQGKIFEAATPAQRPGVAVLWATGCRPAEIEQGVDLEAITLRDGRRMIRVHIPGAKITAVSGQPHRILAIDADSEAGQALTKIMAGQDRVTVQRSASRLRKDFTDIRDRSGLGWDVAPYSMRHQQAAELKTTMDADQVAAALGHRTTRSQSRYGAVAQATGRGSIVAVKADIPVKETRPNRAAKPDDSSPTPDQT